MNMSISYVKEPQFYMWTKDALLRVGEAKGNESELLIPFRQFGEHIFQFWRCIVTPTGIIHPALGSESQVMPSKINAEFLAACDPSNVPDYESNSVIKLYFGDIYEPNRLSADKWLKKVSVSEIETTMQKLEIERIREIDFLQNKAIGDVMFEELMGKTLISIEGGIHDEKLIFKTSEGEVYEMYHNQDCCENVTIEDITGNLDDLIGSPILRAEVSVQDDPEAHEAGMWTFYKLATIKGYVDIRWYGESNGYYSMGVDFCKVTNTATSLVNLDRQNVYQDNM